ncbi:hypothetical protein CR163_002585 [Prosthecochloris sp. ZM_2]|nr:hypothetical protein CR163_002585 [Prosthecochloris sp. ZM_2]
MSLTAHGAQRSGRRQETGDRRQETGDRRQETGDRRQRKVGKIWKINETASETGDRRQETGDSGKLGRYGKLMKQLLDSSIKKAGVSAGFFRST